ncbi:hypothetical protein D3C81_703190 [compost metagenome]
MLQQLLAGWFRDWRKLHCDFRAECFIELLWQLINNTQCGTFIGEGKVEQTIARGEIQ